MNHAPPRRLVGRRVDGGRRRDIVGAALVAALIALALAFGAQRGRRAIPTAALATDASRLEGSAGRYTFVPTAGRLEVASADGRSRLDVELSLVVDGVERPLVMRRSDVKAKDGQTLLATFPVEMGEERATAAMTLRMDPSSDALSASLSVTPDADSAHTFALRASLASEGRSVFVPGSGQLSERQNVEARAVVLDDDVHPFGLFSIQGGVTVSETPPDVEQPGARPRLVVTSRPGSAYRGVAPPAPSPTPTRAPNLPPPPSATPSAADDDDGPDAGDDVDASAPVQDAQAPAPRPVNASRGARASVAVAARLDLSVVVGATSQTFWRRLYGLLRVGTAKVSGVVTGTKERAHVFALDDEGHPQLRAVVDREGRFVVDAPTGAQQWYAALEASASSAPVHFSPGTPWDLRLDVSPGGAAEVRVVDADTGKPIVARLVVKGIEGTLDPSFGPDYRATGAGPLMDLLEEPVTTPLPAGKYRISATKGIEWSIDAENVEVSSGHTRIVELALRHVVPTPGLVGCDLHVHARPSFDSPVTPEDRVVSLISAGIDFAVPTEHNLVGDYGPALEVLKLGSRLAHVAGVEVTTYNPRFGHFGVFPWPIGPVVPAFKGTTAAGVLGSARRGDPNRIVQINHPRLPNGIGYFQIAGFDPRSGRAPVGMRTDFDAIEIYNGYDMANRARVDQVLEDWYALLNLGRRIAATGSSDSHRIQYQWAGYPRTYAAVDARAAGDGGGPIDTAAVVASLKRGRGFVSSGPIIELELGEGGKPARPGDELALKGSSLKGKLRVRAAPWVDVSSVEVLAGSPPPRSGQFAPGPGKVQVLWKTKLPPTPSRFGKEEGTLEEAHARTVRYDGTLSLDLPEGARWVVVVVRGDRLLDDALPFMPIQPLAFTNPVWLAR